MEQAAVLFCTVCFGVYAKIYFDMEGVRSLFGRQDEYCISVV